jgi:hypothetical protein
MSGHIADVDEFDAFGYGNLMSLLQLFNWRGRALLDKS